MSRLQFRGGAWTNAEDQVLKAALAQYGLRDWERVASMLTKKTAAQCRERWESYLDPRLNLHEGWRPDEEEELVQLHALFPDQWRLIAEQLTAATSSHYRRPAWLCEQKYLELRDLFEVERQKAHAAVGPGEKAENDPPNIQDFIAERRRRRMGQRAHEEKPAKPDTVDGERYEAEMLTMAVARLANQDQKKGLRKERQRQLAEASFLAKLESNREAIESGTLSARQEKRMRKALEEDRPSQHPRPDPAAPFEPIDVLEDQARARVERKSRTLLVDLSAQQQHAARAEAGREADADSAITGVQHRLLRQLPTQTPARLTFGENDRAGPASRAEVPQKTPPPTAAVTWDSLAAPAAAAPRLDGLLRAPRAPRRGPPP
ncbi:unnamed protein product [Phytomonas sp. Hart1]|nr:unnamed protein product [Phytomonas sp. Hart1]|eukprot:CCW70786.1 unnamed protein product [Phytomonas sp. isolate Hart1]